MTHARGFTLIEMLLSISIIALLAGISLPVFSSFNTRNDLDITTQGLVSALRRAQLYAKAGQNDSDWGVAVNASGVTLFKGTSFASRDTTFDEFNALSSSSSVSGTSEVFFTKLTGNPSNSATFTLTNVRDESRTVTMNAKGMVSY